MRVHIPTPSIETESVVAYSSERASNVDFDVEFNEKMAQDAQGLRTAAFEKANEMLGDQAEHFSGIRSEYGETEYRKITVLANRFLPVELREWVQCHCGYNKPMHTACGEPCV